MKAWRRSARHEPSGGADCIPSNVVLTDLGEGLLWLAWDFPTECGDPSDWRIDMQYPCPSFENTEIVYPDLSGNVREAFFFGPGAICTRARIRSNGPPSPGPFVLSNEVTPA